MKKGFTLIELLVVTAIIIILTALLLPNYRGSSKQLALQRSASKLAQDLRRAEEMAMSAKEVSGTVPYGFGIYFNIASSSSYILFADFIYENHMRSPGDQDLATIALEPNIRISNLSPASSLNIIFAPPDPKVWINGLASGVTAQITLGIVGDPISNKTVSVNNAGLISISQSPGAGGPYVLTVTPAGNGSGTVTSDVGGINCGADCSEAYSLGTVVTLSAAADSGSSFAGWLGAGCSGRGSCVLTMDAAKSVTATFRRDVVFIAYRRSPGATSTQSIIPRPSGLQVGDLMIAHIMFRTGGATSAPSGWTRFEDRTNGSNVRSTLFWKIADAGDVAASNFTFTNVNSVSSIGAISVFRNYNPGSPILTSNGQVNGAVTTITSPEVTPSVGAGQMIIFFTSASDNNTCSQYQIATDNPAWMERYDLRPTTGSDAAISMAFAMRPQTTATGLGTARSSDADTNAGHLVVIPPVL